MSSNGSGEKIGAALVLGGGIGGIQASLDLADSGYKVYLVEESPAIGGRMAQLDKTFPTNDCSMCILSPKLVECGRHPNIELLTYSQLLELEGEPGNFKVKVLKRSRYIDPQKCTGCGECAEACPVELRSEFDEGLGLRKATYRPYAQAFPNIFTIEKRGTSPCSFACPAGVKPHGYVALTRAGKLEEAFHLILEDTPLVGTLGRVCFAPCQKECTRGLLEGPIPIRRLKRFIADHYYSLHPEPEYGPPEEVRDKRVAVIGSGPAGLAVAYFLARKGYRVKIFEKEKEPGGMLRKAIPSYRLPKDVLERDIKNITALGVEIETGKEIKDLEALFSEGFEAIFIGAGAALSRKMGIKGEDLDGVMHSLDRDAGP